MGTRPLWLDRHDHRTDVLEQLDRSWPLQSMGQPRLDARVAKYQLLSIGIVDCPCAQWARQHQTQDHRGFNHLGRPCQRHYRQFGRGTGLQHARLQLAATVALLLGRLGGQSRGQVGECRALLWL